MTSGSVWHSPARVQADWIFVVGRSFLAVLNSAASARVVSALWSLADTAETAIEDVVAAVSLASDDGVHSFAVVSFAGQIEEGSADRIITAVVRGAAVVDIFSVGGSRRFTAGEVHPWMLAGFRSVTALVLGGDERPTLPRACAQPGLLPLSRGVVSGNAVLWSLAPLNLDAADALLFEALPTASADQHARPVDALDDDDTEATIIRPRRAGHGTQQVASAAAGNGDGDVDGYVDDDTILISRTGSRSAPAQPPSKPAKRANSAAPQLRFAVGSHAPRDLEGPTVFGRNPRAPRVIAGHTPVLVTVDSPEHAVSSSHLRLSQEGAALVATDLRSTNGTILTPTGGKRRRMRPGESVVVLEGTRIDIGDGNIIEIVPAEQSTRPADSVPLAERGPV